jgi:large subunit ribosomal protein L5
MEEAKAELALITGQQAAETRAKKSIANFKLRKDQIIGAKVTLRGDRMYEFLERLIKAALPRIRDFRGVSPRSFDGHGNYTLGVPDQTIFPEIEMDKIKRNIGFDVTIVTTAQTDEEAKSLLSELGMPFADRAKKPAAAAPSNGGPAEAASIS